jgi:hypothetical protein
VLFAKIHPKELENLKYESGRKLGASAKKVFKTNIKYINVLAAFPSISNKSAAYISKTHDIKTLLEKITSEEINALQLAEINKSDKRKIGEKGAEKIIKLLKK